MRWALLVCALSACNRLLGLSSNFSLADASLFDSPVDAQHFCPAVGEVPEYSPIFHQSVAQNCSSYSISPDSDLAVAQCVDSDGNKQISEGAIDGPMTSIEGFPIDTAQVSVYDPRLSPEGDVIYITSMDLTNFVVVYNTFRRAGTTWGPGPAMNLPQYGVPTVPSRGPDRHVLFFDGSRTVQEWHDSNTSTWSHVRDFDAGDSVRGAWFSPDGLRLAFVSGPGPSFTAHYASRAAITDPFGPIADFAVPSASDLFITEDCTRMYLSSVETVFYAREK